jgi:hypothetical protein
MKHALLALLLCFPVMAVAQSDLDMHKSGNDHLRVCEAAVHEQGTARAWNCTVWMNGVLDGFHAYEAFSHTQLYKVPDEVTTGQIEKIAVKYMNDHPKILNLPTSGLVLRALMDIYQVDKK